MGWDRRMNWWTRLRSSLLNSKPLKICIQKARTRLRTLTGCGLRRNLAAAQGWEQGIEANISPKLQNFFKKSSFETRLCAVQLPAIMAR